MPPPFRLAGLPPVVGTDPRVLILGSFPSRLSLERSEYYANPRNRFWPLVETLFGIPVDIPYSERTRLLGEMGIALWDVVASCEREGSEDAAIRNEEVNDIPGFLRDHPSISLVVLNGGGAARLFHRHFSDGVPGPAGSPGSEGAGAVRGGKGREAALPARGRRGPSEPAKGPLWTWIPGVLILTLPSTSPANARAGLPRLLDAWSALREFSGK